MIKDFLLESYNRLFTLGVSAVTIYGDRNDRPLSFSELYNGEKALGRLWGAPWGRKYTLMQRASALAAGFTRSPSEQLPPESCLELLDVVDTTWMQAGLPAGDLEVALDTSLRHSHFTVNQLIVDDLCQLLIHGRRAAERTDRLRRKTGHVYHFAAPPVSTAD